MAAGPCLGATQRDINGVSMNNRAQVPVSGTVYKGQRLGCNRHIGQCGWDDARTCTTRSRGLNSLGQPGLRAALLLRRTSSPVGTCGAGCPPAPLDQLGMDLDSVLFTGSAHAAPPSGACLPP